MIYQLIKKKYERGTKSESQLTTMTRSQALSGTLKPWSRWKCRQRAVTAAIRAESRRAENLIEECADMFGDGSGKGKKRRRTAERGRTSDNLEGLEEGRLISDIFTWAVISVNKIVLVGLSPPSCRRRKISFGLSGTRTWTWRWMEAEPRLNPSPLHFTPTLVTLRDQRVRMQNSAI